MKDNIKKFSPKKNSLARTGFFSNPLTYFLSLSTKRKFDSLNMVCDKPRASEPRIKDDRRCRAINKYAPHLSLLGGCRCYKAMCSKAPSCFRL